MSRKVRRQFSDEFKQQIVALHNLGMKRSELIKEYELTHLPLINGSDKLEPQVHLKPLTI